MKTAILGLLALLTLLASGAALYYAHESRNPALAAGKGLAQRATAAQEQSDGESSEEYASLSRSLAWQAVYCAGATLLLGWWWRDSFRGAGEKLKLIALIALAVLPVGGLWYLGLLGG